MDSYNERKMITWSLLFCLIFPIYNSTLVLASPTRHLCLPDQNHALWEFKNEFQSVLMFSEKTTRWRNNTDCCSWDGVSCNLKTGKVVGLNLMGSFLSGTLRSNSSLFRLQHLQSLNLDLNDFSGILPESIDNLKYLRVLSLGACNFFGKIPSSLGNLTYLTDLDLSDSGFTGELPDSMGGLNRLTDLQIVSTKLSGSFPLMLLNFSELTRVNLRYNQFEGMLPSNMSSLSKLESFDISGNSFSGSIPSSLFMISPLLELDLSKNYFSGSLDIGNMSSPSKLASLSLGENNFNGPIPGYISKLADLLFLDLSFWNTGRGMVDFSIFLHLKSLKSLDLSYLKTRSITDLSSFSQLMSLNSLDLSGINLNISSTLHLPSPLQFLMLSSCGISEFPKFLQTQTNLSSLDISENQIEGQVPEWLWRLPELQSVNISQNSFSCFQGSPDVIQTSGIDTLDMNSNTFQNLPLLPKSMVFFSGPNNRFSGEIPKAICELVALDTLVLSNNKFNGSIPRCFKNFSTTLSILHLQNNNLSGVLPEESITAGLRTLNVGHNRLSGKLPKSLINCTQLEFLNVEDNNLIRVEESGRLSFISTAGRRT